MKTLKLEEMIVNAVLNPNKKFTHIYWKPNEYIYWSKSTSCGCFMDERGAVIDLFDFATALTGWEDFK